MRLFHRPLMVAVLKVVSFPKTTLAIALVLLAASGALAYFRLNISTDQNRLFDPTVPFFRDFIRFGELFPENEAVYIVVERADRATNPPVRRWTQAADELAAAMKRLPDAVGSVDARVPLDQLGEQGLLFDSPQRVRQAHADIKRFVPLVQLWAQEPDVLTRLLGRTPLERFLGALRTQPPSDET